MCLETGSEVYLWKLLVDINAITVEWIKRNLKITENCIPKFQFLQNKSSKQPVQRCRRGRGRLLWWRVTQRKGKSHLVWPKCHPSCTNIYSISLTHSKSYSSFLYIHHHFEFCVRPRQPSPLRVFLRAVFIFVFLCMRLGMCFLFIDVRAPPKPKMHAPRWGFS